MKQGHRRRIFECWPKTNQEHHVSSRAICGYEHDRKHVSKRNRVIARKLLRHHQKKEDQREIKEQTT